VTAAFPAIRAFGPNPYVWRRILLWSAETQVATITAESAQRTEMVRAQVERETQRKRLSREDFLASLSLQAVLFAIDDLDHPRFPRVFELLNKTNQFNTTGRRWARPECAALFAAGGKFFAFEVEDKFTSYGLVGVIAVRAETIDQFVMSCRVAGMDVEIAALCEIIRLAQGDGESIEARMVETPLNLLCRDLYKRCGFNEIEPGRWLRNGAHVLALPTPAHIRMTVQNAEPLAPNISVPDITMFDDGLMSGNLEELSL